MNGSNSLTEADNKPSWLCPNCLAKVTWCTQYDIHERYNSLILFCNKYDYTEEEEFYNKSKNILYKK